MSQCSITVIGGGIAGLTAAALLANKGFAVTLLEAHHQLGGCAGTFRRGSFVFDVGATQVAGIEVGGIHQRLFNHLNVSAPIANVLDPACLVDLGDGSDPISLWYREEKWREERSKQFPGSELFWSICALLNESNWSFVDRNPVLPIANAWDLFELTKAIRPSNILSGLLSKSTIADLLLLCGCHQDKRLRMFLDLQLKLYSQEPADRTAALYGATVLHMAHEPRGLWHLDGSMQSLSNALRDCFLRDGGTLMLNHSVQSITKNPKEKIWLISTLNKQGEALQFSSSDVVFTLPPQLLLKFIPLDHGMTTNYRRRIEMLPKSSGALVLYGAVKRSSLPANCPNHLQLVEPHLGSMFISISCDGDGRAPLGQATLIASSFTKTEDWFGLNPECYQERKNKVMSQIRGFLENWFNFSPSDWLHNELSTPSSFARWTGRPEGGVGGISQHPSQFGPFGLPSRTPLEGIWLCGDSIYPGEGTAGVSQSALMVCRQLMATLGRDLDV